MGYGPKDYWRECIETALDEVDAKLTPEQIAHLAEACEGAHECYGMAFYQPENPMIGEVSRLKRALKDERSKVSCNECGGSGRLRYMAGPWHVDTQCDKCRGEGRHAA